MGEQLTCGEFPSEMIILFGYHKNAKWGETSNTHQVIPYNETLLIINVETPKTFIEQNSFRSCLFITQPL